VNLAVNLQDYVVVKGVVDGVCGIAGVIPGVCTVRDIDAADTDVELAASDSFEFVVGKLDRFDAGVLSHDVSPVLRSKLRHVAGTMGTTSANMATPIAHSDYSRFVHWNAT
jgi:hypothetical protein